MEQFPAPIAIPKSTYQYRTKRQNNLIFASLFGVFLRSFIVIAELLAGFVFGSHALFLDGLATLIDIFSSLCLIFFLKMATKPPDKDHPFGHGRYEPLAGMQIGVFLTLAGIGAAVYQGYLLFTETEQKILESELWLIPLGVIVLLEIGYRTLMKASKKYQSAALVSEAVHYRIDALNSLVAMIALFFAFLIPDYGEFFDHIGAFFIAFLMVYLGVRSIIENVNQLMDKTPDSKTFERVRKAALRVDGVLDTEKTLIQQYGPDAYIAIDIEVLPSMPVDQAHIISQKVRAEIQKEWPLVRDVAVHIEPYYPNDH